MKSITTHCVVWLGFLCLFFVAYFILFYFVSLFVCLFVRVFLVVVVNVSVWYVLLRGYVHHKLLFQGRSLVSVDGDKKMIYQYLEDETATTKTQLRVLQDFIKVHV